MWLKKTYRWQMYNMIWCSTSLIIRKWKLELQRDSPTYRLQWFHSKCSLDRSHQNSQILLVGKKLTKTSLETVWQHFMKLNAHLPYDLAILLLNIYPGYMKVCLHMHVHACSQQLYFSESKAGNNRNVCQPVKG